MNFSKSSSEICGKRGCHRQTPQFNINLEICNILFKICTMWDIKQDPNGIPLWNPYYPKPCCTRFSLSLKLEYLKKCGSWDISQMFCFKWRAIWKSENPGVPVVIRWAKSVPPVWNRVSWSAKIWVCHGTPGTPRDDRPEMYCVKVKQLTGSLKIFFRCSVF